MNEIDELREARKRIRELEAALANSHMDYCLESAFLDIACERLGTSKEKSLLLDRLPGAPRTTDSRHSLPVFHNLVKDMELTGPNQAWAADITYIRTGEGFLYLSLPSKTRVILRNLRTVRTRFYRGTHSPCKGASKCARDWRGLATAQPGPER